MVDAVGVKLTPRAQLRKVGIGMLKSEYRVG